MASLVERGIGLMIATIVVGGVALPVVNDVINTQNFTGITGTVVGYVPVGLAVSLLIAAFAMVKSR